MRLALRRPVACALVVLPLAGCVGSGALSDLPTREIAGHYTATGEGQWFRPCTASEEEAAWWVTFTEEAVEQREAAPFAALLQSEGPLFVHWRVALGDRADGAPEGPGPGTRYALVREILDVRPATDDDCASS